MHSRKSGFCLAILSALLASAQPSGSAEPLRIRALAFNSDGTLATGIPAGAWSAVLAGKEAKVLSVAGPAETSKAPLNWAVVFLPIQNPSLRKLSLISTARFLETLPAGDRVLVAAWGSRGLGCLTPGFTTRPSLWAAALDSLIGNLPAKLTGDPHQGFPLPPSPQHEGVESMAPVQAFLRKVEGTPFDRCADDLRSGRNVFEDYLPQQLPGIADAVTGAFGTLERFAAELAGVPGEKEVVVFSRNENDDLASPVWAEAMAGSGVDGIGGRTLRGHGRYSYSDLILVTNMHTDVSLARLRVMNAFAQPGITLHNVTGSSGSYEGALGEAVQVSGGHSFHFSPDLVQTLPIGLGLWTEPYLLTVDPPQGLRHPFKVRVSVHGKGLKVIGPTQQ